MCSSVISFNVRLPDLLCLQTRFNFVYLYWDSGRSTSVCLQAASSRRFSKWFVPQNASAISLKGACGTRGSDLLSAPYSPIACHFVYPWHLCTDDCMLCRQNVLTGSKNSRTSSLRLAIAGMAGLAEFRLNLLHIAFVAASPGLTA